jgi:hypothetical protein
MLAICEPQNWIYSVFTMESYIRAGVLGTFLVQITPILILLFMMHDREYWLFYLFFESVVAPIGLLFWYQERCTLENKQWVVSVILAIMTLAAFVYGILGYKYETRETFSKSGAHMDAFLLVLLSALGAFVQFVWPVAYVLCETAHNINYKKTDTDSVSL